MSRSPAYPTQLLGGRERAAANERKLVIVFMVGGTFAILTVIAIYQAVDAARWRDGKRGLISVFASLLLAILTYSALSIGARYPGYNFWGNAGYGPDWECSNAPNSASACARDLPARLQDQPANRN